MSKDELRHKLADLVIVCDDGTEVPCSAYTVAAASQVVRNVLEDCFFENTGCRKVPFPGIDAASLKSALAVIHGTLETSTIDSLADIHKVAEGMRVLGCTEYEHFIRQRAWTLLKNMRLDTVPTGTQAAERVKPWIPEFLAETSLRVDVLKWIARTVGPTWKKVHLYLKEAMAPSIDLPMAQFLVTALCKMYPVSMVIKTVLGMTSNLTLDQALTIIGAHSTGTYYHPSEVRDVLQYMRKLFGDSGFIGAMVEGMSTYDFAPYSKCTGSVVGFSNGTQSSAVLILDGKPPRGVINVCKWFKLTLDPELVVVVKGSLIDEVAKKAPGLQVRLMVYRRDSGTGLELWGLWNQPDWSPTDKISFFEDQALLDQEQLQAQIPALRRIIECAPNEQIMIRLDVFYGPTSVLVNPLIY